MQHESGINPRDFLKSFLELYVSVIGTNSRGDLLIGAIRECLDTRLR